jgi:glyoxylase-like metal-dependent hydrolase (beta-lactamase superfamily II)
MTAKGSFLARIISFAFLAAVAVAPRAPVHAEAALPHIPMPAKVESMRVLPGITERLSPHVYAIPANGRAGVANIGIVVGARAVLVIETGLGRPNGQVVLDETRRVAGDRRIYVIATHSHPEHIGGEQAFPASAVILRPAGQQEEVETLGPRLIASFRGFSADNQELLRDFAYRPADIVFPGSMTLDLGGVTVDIIDAAPAHTDGDVAMLVRQDGVLFAGDVVQQNYAPVMGGAHSTIASWLAQIDKLEKLPATIVVPSHSAITDRKAFADMRAFVTFLRDDWAAIRAKGLSGDQAANTLVADVKARFPACGNAELVKMSIPKL